MSPKPTPADLRLERFLPYLLNVLARRASVGLATVYEERFGLTIPEWRVMAHLANHELVSSRELTTRVDMDKSKVSRAVARLEKSDLLRRRISKDDRRLEELALTKAGERLFAEIAPLALEYERRLVSSLTAEEEAELRRIVDRLLKSNALVDLEMASEG